MSKPFLLDGVDQRIPKLTEGVPADTPRNLGSGLRGNPARSTSRRLQSQRRISDRVLQPEVRGSRSHQVAPARRPRGTQQASPEKLLCLASYLFGGKCTRAAGAICLKTPPRLLGPKRLRLFLAQLVEGWRAAFVLGPARSRTPRRRACSRISVGSATVSLHIYSIYLGNSPHPRIRSADLAFEIRGLSFDPPNPSPSLS